MSTIPPDNLKRSLTVVQPDNLPHIGLVGDIYTITVTGEDTDGASVQSICTSLPAEDRHVPTARNRVEQGCSRPRSVAPPGQLCQTQRPPICARGLVLVSSP
jgi:hypothetical protein